MNVMQCIHGALSRKICKRCQAPIIKQKLDTQKFNRKKMLGIRLDELIDSYVDLHIGSYSRSGNYYNVHVHKNSLIREITRFVLEEL